MRRSVKIATIAVTVAALAMTGCSNSSKPSKKLTGGGSGGGGGGQTFTIGFMGPLSGQNAQLGINEFNGFKVAIADANKDSTLGFKVKYVQSDDEGDSAKAPAAATQLTSNPAVLGVVGPAFSGVTAAAGSIFDGAGLPFITPSASNGTLQDKGFKTFHRIVPNDNVEGSQAADWLARKGIKKLYVLQDLSTYGKGVGDTVTKEATAKGVKVTESGLDGTTTKNYGPIAQTIASSGATALFYGGYDAQAALLVKSLQAANYKGLIVGGNGIKSSVFTSGAGAAGNGVFMTCGCQDATVAPASKAFTAEYQSTFNTPPSTYSPEAYDATNVVLQSIKAALAKGAPTRASVLEAMNGIDFTGITTMVKFESNGEVVATAQTVNLFEQKAGKIVQVGNIKDQN